VTPLKTICHLQSFTQRFTGILLLSLPILGIQAPEALSAEDKELERVKFAAPGSAITSSDFLAGK
jgi:hypothetical protein